MSATTGVHGPDLPPAEATGPERVGAWSGPPAWLVGAVVAAGVVLRLIVLLGPLGRPDSDEVI
ncbi:MAG: hypothetical protein ACXV5S_12410, partial [Acidimicrobiales bacterium]